MITRQQYVEYLICTIGNLIKIEKYFDAGEGFYTVKAFRGKRLVQCDFRDYASPIVLIKGEAHGLPT